MRTAGLIILLLSTVTLACGQQSGCNVPQDSDAKYELIFEHKNELPPQTILGKIYVSPRNFTDDFMLRLLRKLTYRYRNENSVSLSIFDDKSAAKDTDMWEYLAGRKKVPQLRGFYSFDRKDNLCRIDYSSVRGNPVEEIKVVLQNH